MLCVWAVLALAAFLCLLVFSLAPRKPPPRGRTGVIEDILLQAVRAYRDETGAYPSELTDPNRSRPGEAQNPPEPPGYRPADRDRRARIRSLLEQLEGEPASLRFLQKLPPESVNAKERLLLDGYGRHLDYRESGGPGGGPAIISAGADGDFDTEADNIRSDGHGR